MNFKLLPIEEKDLVQFKADMQEAFQQGAIKEFADIDTQILPEEDIIMSLSKENAFAYKAVVDGIMLGGCIVIIDENTNHKKVTKADRSNSYLPIFCFISICCFNFFCLIFSL